MLKKMFIVIHYLLNLEIMSIYIFQIIIFERTK